MRIIDNFLDETLSEELENFLLHSVNFPWFFVDFGTCPKQDLDKYPAYAANDRPQFGHSFYNTSYSSNYYPLVNILVKKLEELENTNYFSRLIRIKANLILQDKLFDKDSYHFPHVDQFDAKTISLLYYVNNSDGDTFLFDEEKLGNTLTLKNRVSPVKNRAVLFESHRLHASSSPINSKFRCVINAVFHKV